MALKGLTKSRVFNYGAYEDRTRIIWLPAKRNPIILRPRNVLSGISKFKYNTKLLQ